MMCEIYACSIIQRTNGFGGGRGGWDWHGAGGLECARLPENCRRIGSGTNNIRINGLRLLPRHRDARLFVKRVQRTMRVPVLGVKWTFC